MGRLCSFLALVVLLPGCAKHTAPSPDASFANGQQALANGSYDVAVTWFSSAIEVDPNNAAAYRLRAEAHYLKGEAMPPRPTEGLAAIKSLANPIEEFESTIADATKAIELDPEDAEAYLLRAKAIHLKGGEGAKDLTVADCTKALELAAEGPVADQAKKLREAILGR